MSGRMLSISGGAAIACSLVMLVGGCPVVPVPDTGAPELAGAWSAFTDDCALVVITFDATGVLTGIAGTTSDELTAEIPVAGGSTLAAGGIYTVTIPLGAITALFQGTLSADQNTLSGVLSTQIAFGDAVTITLPQGGLTLVRGSDGGGEPPAGCGPDTDFSNTTDKTNNAASYVGSTACRQCHPQIADWQRIHGHAYKLTAVNGAAPAFPAEAIYAGVPNPPEGFDWSDIVYVIGGYTKKGRFINSEGYTLTTGVDGVNTQWNLRFPANGTVPGFVAYEPAQETPKPYNYACFICHTTGPTPQDPQDPRFQENRPGFAGTWAEPGIQCESCHGPGSNHFTADADDVIVQRAGIFIDPDGAKTCNECHNRPFNDTTGKIVAKGGFIQHHEQWPELQASGGHSAFTCITCHDPHRSVIYDRQNAIRVACTDCHEGHDMARHDGAVFVRGDYSEPLSCESCHMPFATKSASAATTAVVGDQGRMGDVRTHIFRIDTRAVAYTAMFAEDGSEVVRDGNGLAAVTLDFVCLRCHNGIGNAFALTVQFASGMAPGLHAE